jgi:microcystin-dependent protein
MLKVTYDVNNNGIVDNAEKVNNHTVEKDVPANAVFTDTTYSEATTSQSGLMSSTDKNNLDSNTEARHTHSNKSVLDGIDSTDITNWNNKLDESDLEDYVKNTDYAASKKAGVFKVSNGVVVGNTGYITCSPKTFDEYNGLSNNYFISKGTLENVITGKNLATKSDIPKYYLGTSETEATTRAKVVNCEGFVLEDGATISVLFTNAQTYNGAPQLNVNGTGAIGVQSSAGVNGVRYMWSAGEIIDFTYDGTYWVCHGRGTATTSYYGLTKLATSADSDSQAYALTPRSLYYLANYSIAPYYSASGTYAVGDKVRYTYYLYECITAIDTPEAWNAEHWKQLDPLQEQIDDKEDKSNKVTSISSTSTNTQYPGAKAVYDFAQSMASIGGDTLPLGAIIPFGSDTIPENWLLCDGQAVSRTTYQELFSAIGTTYGNGDGSTTFNLPDLQGKIPVGKDENDEDFDTLGNTGGEKEHTLTINEMPTHNHHIAVRDNNATGLYETKATNATGDVGDAVTANEGGSQPHNILQPYIVQNYIIKAKQSAGVVATVVDGLNSTSTTDALSAKQGKILNEKFSRNIITAYASQTSTVAGVNKWLELNELAKVGNKLNIVNNNIVIGVGVNKIKVSAKVLIDEQQLTTSFIYIGLNNNIINRGDGYGIYNTITLTDKLLNVSQGDVINVSVTSGTNATVYEDTYITVEVVD